MIWGTLIYCSCTIITFRTQTARKSKSLPKSRHQWGSLAVYPNISGRVGGGRTTRCYYRGILSPRMRRPLFIYGCTVSMQSHLCGIFVHWVYYFHVVVLNLHTNCTQHEGGRRPASLSFSFSSNAQLYVCMSWIHPREMSPALLEITPYVLLQIATFCGISAHGV